MRTLLATLSICALIAAGCGGSREMFFPLEVGNSWSYKVKTGLARRVDEVKVADRRPMAGEVGFKLEGPSGPSLLHWKDGKLLATELSGTRYSPALPIFAETGTVAWKGYVTAAGSTRRGSATLLHEPSTFRLASKKQQAVQTTLEIRTGKEVRVIETLFVAGLGIVEQRELVGAVVQRSAEYVSGP